MGGMGFSVVLGIVDGYEAHIKYSSIPGDGVLTMSSRLDQSLGGETRRECRFPKSRTAGSPAGSDSKGIRKWVANLIRNIL